jgi:ferric-dicitrate binding protein FerR (iron transport regulator)
MSWHDSFRRAARETEPAPDAVARVNRRVIGAWAGVRPDREAFALLVQPRPDAVERVTRRVLARHARPRRDVRPWVAGALLAAALLLLVLRPAPPDGALDVPLASVTPVERTLTAEVALEFQGSGEATGTRRAPRIRWEAGTVSLDVRPNAGVELTVETPEGRVEVRGTSFSVTRDDLGTHVAVTRGSVAVVCLDGRSTLLGAGDDVVCEPVRAMGMLSRAHALRDGGAAAPAILAAIDRGLGLATPGEPARLELLALRLDVLVAAGRDAEALAAAEAYLAEGDGPRHDEVVAWAESLRARLGSP